MAQRESSRHLRRRFINRLVGLFTRWGLLKHPYGREYAKENYSLTGRFTGGDRD